MAGIYIHIPFCRKACLYCNFHFSTSLKQKNDFISALLKEIERAPLLNNNPVIETIYLGGGTPSLLEAEELQSIFDALHQKFTIDAEAEITLEANPDDINHERLNYWKQNTVNRLSIGIQSFFEDDLKWMNRAHSAQQAAQCIPLAQEMGFNNLSIDLIYGTPTLTDTRWKGNVERALAYKIPHLSCYALTVEPSTALQHLVDKQKMQDVDPEQQARQFLQLTEWLHEAGYEHYEISNFAQPGCRSRHNSSYWQGKPYYGFGPSAHSFDGIATRSWNVANNALYIKAIGENNLQPEQEVLTQVQQLNEYIMTALRTMEGIDLNRVSETFGIHRSDNILHTANPYLHDKLVIDARHLKLTQKGKLFADGLAAEMFQE